MQVDARDKGLTPGLRISPGAGHGNPLPVFLPGENHAQGAWWVHSVAESDMIKAT